LVGCEALGDAPFQSHHVLVTFLLLLIVFVCLLFLSIGQEGAFRVGILLYCQVVHASLRVMITITAITFKERLGLCIGSFQLAHEEIILIIFV